MHTSQLKKTSWIINTSQHPNFQEVKNLWSQITITNINMRKKYQILWELSRRDRDTMWANAGGNRCQSDLLTTGLLQTSSLRKTHTSKAQWEGGGLCPPIHRDLVSEFRQWPPPNMCFLWKCSRRSALRPAVRRALFSSPSPQALDRKNSEWG